MPSPSTTTDRRQRSPHFALSVALILVMAVAASTLGIVTVGQGTSSATLVASSGGPRLVTREGFERNLKGWEKVNPHTRIDRVRPGQAGSGHSARLRPPRHQRATIGLTDAPASVRNSDRGQVYRARVWVRASKRAVGPGAVTARISLVEKSSTKTGTSAWRRVRLTNTRWRSVTVWLTARGNGHRIDVSVHALDVPARGAVRVDNITLHKVSAPNVKASVLRGTKFGASVDNEGTDWSTALRRSDRLFGHLDVVRVYDPDLPRSWAGRLGSTKRPLVYSFRAKPSAVVSGMHDREIRRWFRQAPQRWPIWWTYQHEPEDDIERREYTASRYRQAWRHVNQIARSVHNKQLRPTLILMCWTLSPNSGRSFSRYYPGDFIKVLAWDCYNSSSIATRYKPPSEMFSRAVRKTQAMHKRFGVAEVGSRILPGDDGSRRAQWLADVADYTARHNAAFVTYWDARIPAGNFTLRDLPSRRIWHRVVSAR